MMKYSFIPAGAAVGIITGNFISQIILSLI